MEKRTLYGTHAVRAAWLNPARRTLSLTLTEQAAKGFEAVVGQARAAGLNRPAPRGATRVQIDRLCPPGAVHQGVVMEAEALPEADVSDFAAAAGPAVVVVLDQVTDPHNVGAILRSSCAFGAAGLVMQRRRAPALDGALAKAASGAVEHVPVALPTNIARALEALKDGGFTVVGLDERGTDIGAMDVPERAALVLGAEGPGMRRLTREACDLTVRLPSRGPVGALNVSNAAAVGLFTLMR